jgi:hypothetical protein
MDNEQSMAVAARIDTAALMPLLVSALATAAQKARQEESSANWRPVYTADEVAKMFGWTKRQVDDERRRGRIGFVRLASGRIYFRRSDVEQYIAARAVPPAVSTAAESQAA